VSSSCSEPPYSELSSLTATPLSSTPTRDLLHRHPVRIPRTPDQVRKSLICCFFLLLALASSHSLAVRTHGTSTEPTNSTSSHRPFGSLPAGQGACSFTPLNRLSSLHSPSFPFLRSIVQRYSTDPTSFFPLFRYQGLAERENIPPGFSGIAPPPILVPAVRTMTSTRTLKD
jgi:hypothetical protein